MTHDELKALVKGMAPAIKLYVDARIAPIEKQLGIKHAGTTDADCVRAMTARIEALKDAR